MWQHLRGKASHSFCSSKGRLFGKGSGPTLGRLRSCLSRPEIGSQLTLVPSPLTLWSPQWQPGWETICGMANFLFLFFACEFFAGKKTRNSPINWPLPQQIDIFLASRSFLHRLAAELITEFPFGVQRHGSMASGEW